MITTLDYIYGLKGSQHELFLSLHSFILGYDGIKSSIKYGIPFYHKNKMLCYANPLKPQGAELVFWSAKRMNHSLPFLDFKKRESMAGITINGPNEINYELLDAILQEALQIDASFATSQS